MWVSRRRWRELRAVAAQAEPAMWECDQLRERVAELKSKNARLLAWLRQAQNPGDVHLLDPARSYEPREYGTGGLDVSEAPVAACGVLRAAAPGEQPVCGPDQGGGVMNLRLSIDDPTPVVDDPTPCARCEGGRQISDHGGVGPCPDCCCVICGASTTTPPECDSCFMESERYWRWRQ